MLTLKRLKLIYGDQTYDVSTTYLLVSSIKCLRRLMDNALYVPNNLNQPKIVISIIIMLLEKFVSYFVVGVTQA